MARKIGVVHRSINWQPINKTPRLESSFVPTWILIGTISWLSIGFRSLSTVAWAVCVYAKQSICIEKRWEAVRFFLELKFYRLRFETGRDRPSRTKSILDGFFIVLWFWRYRTVAAVAQVSLRVSKWHQPNTFHFDWNRRQFRAQGLETDHRSILYLTHTTTLSGHHQLGFDRLIRIPLVLYRFGFDSNIFLTTISPRRVFLIDRNPFAGNMCVASCACFRLRVSLFFMRFWP